MINAFHPELIRKIEQPKRPRGVFYLRHHKPEPRKLSVIAGGKTTRQYKPIINPNEKGAA